MLEKGDIKSVIWREGELQLADYLTKVCVSGNKLLMALEGTSKKLSRANGILSKLRHFAPKKTLISVYYTIF